MILVITILVVCLIIFLYKNYRNKLTFVTIKLDDIKEKINSVLIKRLELIKESEKLIKEIVNTDKQIYEGLEDLNKQKLDMFEFDRKLLIYVNEFDLIEDKYKELKDNEEFKKVTFSINETTDLLDAYKEFYNDNAIKYNKLIKVFPASIVSFIKRRKELLFFDKKSTNDNDYSDFKF